MIKLEDKFVPYEESLRMKNLGYDEQCFGFWSSKNQYRRFINDSLCNTDLINMFGVEAKKAPAAILWKDAFDWFRDNHGLHYFIDIYPTNEEPNRCWYMIRYMNRERGDDDYMSGFFLENHQAQLGCINKLIKIVEQLNETTGE
jgi:hypothetical protein